MILRLYSPYKKLFQTTFTTCLRNLSTTKALRKNHYEALELNRNATAAEIKNAYFRLTKIYHPDRIAATDENLKKFREISEAYEVLGNEHSRKLYDKGLLGDVKRVGMESTDSTDPIVAFYKQRQDMGKIISSKPDGIGIWTQSSFAEAKQKKMHDLFSMKTSAGMVSTPVTDEMFLIVYFIILGYFFSMNFEGTAASNHLKALKNFLGL